MCPAYPADTERPQPPVRFRYVHPPRRLRPIAPAVHPGVQVPKIRFEVLPVVVPRHVVHPRRGLRPKHEVRRPQAIDINAMQERGEPHILVLPRQLAHATQLT